MTHLCHVSIEISRQTPTGTEHYAMFISRDAEAEAVKAMSFWWKRKL